MKKYAFFYIKMQFTESTSIVGFNVVFGASKSIQGEKGFEKLIGNHYFLFYQF